MHVFYYWVKYLLSTDESNQFVVNHIAKYTLQIHGIVLIRTRLDLNEVRHWVVVRACLNYYLVLHVNQQNEIACGSPIWRESGFWWWYIFGWRK